MALGEGEGMALTSNHNADVQQSLREWTFPEEDRALYTTAPWRGGYRWFRATNVVPIEQWRRNKAQGKHTTPTPTSPAQGA
jgi:hypothetical protein